MATLRDRIAAVQESDVDMQRKARLLCSIKGIASALLDLAELTSELGKVRNPEVAALVGFARDCDLKSGKRFIKGGAKT